MAEFKLLITDHPWGDAEIERDVLESEGVTIVEAPDGEPATLVKLARDADAIATCWAKVGKDVISAAPKCRHIARMGIGLDNIDLETATGRGIVVTNVPDYCVEEVADHTLALLLACLRNVGFYHHQIKQGKYALTEGPPIHRLSGLTLGLVGFGQIAREVYQRAKPFGFKIQATTPSGNDYGTGCRMVPLEKLLKTSDAVSLHAPLTSESQKLINEKTLKLMKPTACLVNTSRGGLIDQDGLAAALTENRLASAGLDVFSPEPPDLKHPLFANERVVATPHSAFVSEESLIELRQRVARQVLAVKNNQPPENVVNGIAVGRK